MMIKYSVSVTRFNSYYETDFAALRTPKSVLTQVRRRRICIKTDFYNEN
ncbi:hypothetical protein APA_3143 [Pseudanabaena sp. lw0831]|nr:hypothetical protein APA_3143 [Pseudanabaena sp. lw0831]